MKELLGIAVTETETLYGHNGNVILDCKASLAESDADGLFLRVLDGLNSADRLRLLGELRGHIDEKGTFFLRLDKQQLLLGNLTLAESDAVRIRVRLDRRSGGAEELIRERLK